MLVRRAAFAVLVLVSGAAGYAEDVTLPAGTRVHVQLDRDLRSDAAAEGDTFDATVTTPVPLDGHVVIPAGSAVSGRITVVRSLTRSGVFGVRFEALRLPEGRIYDIDGVLSPTRDGEPVPVPGKKEAVVVIGSEADAPGKRASTLVGGPGEDQATLANRWSQSGLSPRLAQARAGTELTLELREPLTVEVR